MHCAERVHVIQAHPPPEQSPDGADLDVGRRHGLEVADHRHAPHIAVETAGVRSQDILGDSACAALEHLAVLVDERVVGDVAPAQRPGVVGVDGSDDRCGVFRGVVVTARGVVHDGGSNPVAVHRPAAAHGVVGTPLGAADDVGWLTRTECRRGWVPLGVHGCFRWCDQHRRDVLGEGLFDVRGNVAEFLAGVDAGLGRRGGDRSALRAGHRDLDIGGGADEDRFGAARAAALAVVGVGLQGVGVVPGSPGSVGLLGPDPGCGAGQVGAGQRHHREGGGLADLPDGLAAGEAGQRLLVEHRVSRAGSAFAVGSGPAGDRPRQDDDCHRDRGEQDRRCGSARRHKAMLRMGPLLQVFRHGPV